MLSQFRYSALFLLISVSILSAADPSPIPKHFSADIGGFMGASYQVELHESVLIYTSFESGHSRPNHVTLTPTATQWSEFRQVLDALKVWQWRGSYSSNGVADGTQWSLEIGYEDHAIKTHGDNNYPDASGKPNGNPEPTKAFRRYLEAVKKLTGGKSFQ